MTGGLRVGTQTFRWMACCLSWIGLSLVADVGRCAESDLNNGDFSRWTNGVPDDWEVVVGARNGGEQPLSELKFIKGPALLLQGDRSTMAWRSVSQEVSIPPGEECVLEFESATRDVRREGQQYDNCYVGMMSFGADGNPVGREIQELSKPSNGWAKHELHFVVPSEAASTKVIIFLSKSGMLGVRNLKLSTSGAAAESPSGSEVTESSAAGPLVANGRFLEWSGGRPEGWTMEIGARNGGDEPTSTVEKVDQGGVRLSGNGATMAWYSLSQELDLHPGMTYTLTVEARGSQVRQERGQYDNCYVGVMSLDGGGQRLDMAIKDLSRVTRLQSQRVHFQVPDKAVANKLLIFLSKTGALTVKNVSVKEATPDRPFRGASR